MLYNCLKTTKRFVAFDARKPEISGLGSWREIVKLFFELDGRLSARHHPVEGIDEGRLPAASAFQVDVLIAHAGLQESQCLYVAIVNFHQDERKK